MEIIKDRFEEILEQTKKDLEVYAREDKITLRDRIRALLGRKKPPKDYLNWPAGLLLLGLFEAGETETVRQYFEARLQEGKGWVRVDDALAGYVLLLLYEETGDESLEAAAHDLYRFLREAPVNEEGSLIYNPAAGNTAVFADGAGMATMFFVKYGMLFQNEEALRKGREEMLRYRQSGMDEASALPYHGFIKERNEKKGLIGWGRAVGWLLLGLSVYVHETAAVRDAEMIDFYRGLCETAASYQKENGLFPWQLTKEETVTDTSASAMISFSMLFGGATEDGNIREAVEKCYTALYDGAESGVVKGTLSECLDFGNHPQTYGHYPWGQGAALAFLSVKRRTHLR